VSQFLYIFLRRFLLIAFHSQVRYARCSELDVSVKLTIITFHSWSVSKVVALLFYASTGQFKNNDTVTYSGFSIHDGTLLHSKSQYTTVKHRRRLLEHTYTSDPHGLGTPTPIEFFQQDLLWQSTNTRSHSCCQKASIHTSGQSIVGLSVRLHTTTAPRRIVNH
jgi:hypothetical protein